MVGSAITNGTAAMGRCSASDRAEGGCGLVSVVPRSSHGELCSDKPRTATGVTADVSPAAIGVVGGAMVVSCSRGAGVGGINVTGPRTEADGVLGMGAEKSTGWSPTGDRLGVPACSVDRAVRGRGVPRAGCTLGGTDSGLSERLPNESSSSGCCEP